MGVVLVRTGARLGPRSGATSWEYFIGLFCLFFLLFDYCFVIVVRSQRKL